MNPLRILHLSDTHFAGDGGRHYGVVDTDEHLRRALAHVAHLPLDLVVCSGDVSEDGSVLSYRRVHDAIVPWARARGAGAVFAMGNHDRRSGFREVFGGGQQDAAEEVFPGDDPERPIASISTRDGWRVIVLDTSVPGAGFGDLEPEQLAFLRTALATPAAHGTILVLHHPPVDAQTDLLQALALDAAAGRALIDTVRGTDVRVILSGHYHLPLVEFVAGIPVIVAPGVTNLSHAFADRTEESAIDAFGGMIIEVDADRVRVVPFVERLEPDDVVFHFDAQVVEQIIQDAGRWEK